MSLELFRPPAEGTSVALGFFDGFHVGHQAIVGGALRGPGNPVVFTFKNHPATVVDVHRSPRLITTFRERVERLLSSGATVVWTDFDRPFSQLEPDQFVERVLLGRLGARRAVVGPNYRYGHRAAGDVDALRAAGAARGFEVEVVEAVREAGDLVSSTRIRALIEAGDVSLACQLMGVPFVISAIVQRGAARGRTIGTPTANLSLPVGKVIPPYGVYAVRVAHRAHVYPGVANLGVRPTFKDESEPLLEVHLLDCAIELYGDLLEVHFIERLRAEQKFAGIEALKAQIARDLEAARELLAPGG